MVKITKALSCFIRAITDIKRKEVSALNISKILFLSSALCLSAFIWIFVYHQSGPDHWIFSSGNLLTTVFYGVLIAVPVLIILLSTVIQEAFCFSISNSRMLGVLSPLMGALMIASGVIHLMNLLLVRFFSAVMFSTLIITALQIVMAALSGIVFYISVSATLKKTFPIADLLPFFVPTCLGAHCLC